MAECYKAIFDIYQKDNEFLANCDKIIDFDFNVNYENVFENYVMYCVISKYDNE